MQDTSLINRREALRRAVCGTAALALANCTGQTLSGGSAVIRPRAKSVIQIWMWGGPCHLDTFDDVCVPKAHFASWGKPEELFGWIFTEIVLLNIEDA